ncbi:2630_t:CDS:2 [Paraglomus brasilianum]|uniref:2630_t:CDS:1 n=1 Tax=Paraglomus brasilianum TaxID=144538 RepID=A0A9N9BCP8_9GLOM|nr:2630_t:CDS:2 [Paraglomus brasilianum]
MRNFCANESLLAFNLLRETGDFMDVRFRRSNFIFLFEQIQCLIFPNLTAVLTTG